jgi:nicotinamide-nucleotide adenylyltransferase
MIVSSNFSRTLSAFKASTDRFSVLYSLPWSPHGKLYRNSRDNAVCNQVGSGVHSTPKTKVKRIIVLDSSFNPPTRAHAAMLRSALAASGERASDEERTTKILLLLAVKNADKAPQPAAFPLRLGMMSGFGQEVRGWDESHGLSVDVGVTTEPYFHDKAQAIQSSGLYGEDEGPEQVFLAGFDTLIRIFNPKYYNDEGGMQAALGPFFAACRLRITLRGDDDWGSAEEQRVWVRSLEQKGEGGIEDRGGRAEWLDRIELVHGVEGEAVSSSRVREAARTGGDLDRMVGPEVGRWIEEAELYRDR